jgi:flagellar hook-basal body complex protein FliE
MSLIGSISSLNAAPLSTLKGAEALKPSSTSLLKQAAETASSSKAQESGAAFNSVFDNLIEAVDTKQMQANQLTKDVLLGNSDQLHQSVIAMQEASVAFSLMVEVRNKLVDSYQELMRLPV